MIEVGKSYTGDKLRELAGDEGSERVWAFAFVKEGKDIILVCEDEGNDNWKVLSVMGQEEKGGVFYSLCEDDILEVANALGEELTPDEMARAKSTVADGVGEHWWGVTEDVIGDILRERRDSDDSSEGDH